MNRSKRIYILLGVLVVICVLAFGVSKFEEHKEVIKNSDEIILELASDTVQSLSWEYNSQTFSFYKDENWLYDEDEVFPVDEEKINELLSVFEEFGASFIIEEVEDYEQYGFDDPICTIRMETEEETYEVLLGDYSTMDSERYVYIGDGNVYLVTNDPMDYFDAELSDIIDHDEISVFDKVTEVQFSGTEEYQFVYEENSINTYCDDDVYFIESNGGYLPLDTSRVDSYLLTISNLSLTDYQTYDVTEEELDTYGLDDPELTVSINYISEDENGEEALDNLILNISRDPEEIKEDKDEDEEITAYVRVGESKIVYKIDGEDYKELMNASYDDLRHLEVLSADFYDIYQIDISLDDKDYTLTSEGEDDVLVWYHMDEEFEIVDFQSAITNLVVDSFTDEEPTEKEEISFTVYLDNENYPEVKVEIYRYNGTYCLAVVDKETVSLVERTAVVDLIESINAIVLN